MNEVERAYSSQSGDEERMRLRTMTAYMAQIIIQQS